MNSTANSFIPITCLTTFIKIRTEPRDKIYVALLRIPSDFVDKI